MVKKIVLGMLAIVLFVVVATGIFTIIGLNLTQQPAKDPAKSVVIEGNNDSSPGTYADSSTLTWLKDLRCALQSDPIVLAEFLAYMGELDGFVNGATNDETATIDSAAKLFIEDSSLRDRAIRKAFDLYGDKIIMPNANMELLGRQVAELRAVVPLNSTDFASEEDYAAYMQRLGKLYGSTEN